MNTREQLLYNIDSRLLKQPRWVQDLISNLNKYRSDLQRSLDDLKRTSDQCDGRIVRGYETAGAGEALPSQDIYFFHLSGRAGDHISVKLDSKEGRLYVSSRLRRLRIYPQAANAFFIEGA